MSTNKLPSLTEAIVGSMAVGTLPPDAVTDAPRIERMFEIAFAQSPQSEFLASIYDWWQKKSFLTKSQFVSLAKQSQRQLGENEELNFDDE